MTRTRPLSKAIAERVERDGRALMLAPAERLVRLREPVLIGANVRTPVDRLLRPARGARVAAHPPRGACGVKPAEKPHIDCVSPGAPGLTCWPQSVMPDTVKKIDTDKEVTNDHDAE